MDKPTATPQMDTLRLRLMEGAILTVLILIVG
jgi:hypothetical protein